MITLDSEKSGNKVESILQEDVNETPISPEEFIKELEKECEFYKIPLLNEEDYRDGTTIGAGNFGIVSLVEGKEHLVIKRIRQDNEKTINRLFLKFFITEVASLTYFKGHSNIVQLHGVISKVYIDNKDNIKKVNLAIIFGYIDGESLSEYTNGLKDTDPNDEDPFTEFSDEEKFNLSIQLFQALELIHSKNIIHRDIKPESFMLYTDENDNWKISLLGFNLAFVKNTSESYSNQICGTINYQSPESLYQNDLNQIKVDYSFDIWSAGCVLLGIFMQVKPWNKFLQDQSCTPKISANLKKGTFKLGSLLGNIKVEDKKVEVEQLFKEKYPDVFNILADHVFVFTDDRKRANAKELIEMLEEARKKLKK